MRFIFNSRVPSKKTMLLTLLPLLWCGLCSYRCLGLDQINGTDLEARQIAADNPCNCYFKDSCGCICSRPISWAEFQALPQNFMPCRSFTLALRGGQFHSFPADYFYPVGNVQDFVLDVGRASFQYLNDPEGDSSPYNGVTFDESAYIRMFEVNVNRRWNWGAMSWLAPTTRRAYCEIQIVHSTVPLLEADFGRICQGAVTVASVMSSNLIILQDEVFVPFYKLVEVDLSNNRIQEMRRSYFAYPARELEYINLENNDIHRLPNNMFVEMPSLQSVILRGNPIATLDVQALRPTFNNVEIIGPETESPLEIEQKTIN